jgi:hypothetical protein
LGDARLIPVTPLRAIQGNAASVKRRELLKASGWITVLVAALLPLPVVALNRLVDGDEGYYLMAARLVREGQVPYRDFFYPQSPLLPHVYAVLPGGSWQLARLFTALVAAVLALLVGREVVDLTGRRGVGALAVIATTMSGFALAWTSVVKTYAVGGLLLFLAYRLTRTRGSTSRGALTAGLVLGLAVLVRLNLALPGLALLAAVVWSGGPARQQLRRALAFVLGTALGLLPLGILASTGWERTWFNLLGYHAMRSADGAVGGLAQKAQTLASLFGPGSPHPLQAAQFAVLLALASGAALSPSWRRRTGGLPWLVLGLLAAANALPTPTYDQYFVTLLPYVVVLAAGAVVRLYDLTVLHEERGRGARTLTRAVLTVATVLYVGVGLLSVRPFVSGGEGVPGVGNPTNSRLGEIETINRCVAALANDGPVLTWWPGYLYATDAAALPGMENHFGIDVAGDLSPQDRADYRLIDVPGVAAAIARQTPSAIVLGNSTDPASWEPMITTAGYKLFTASHRTRLYLRPGLAAMEANTVPAVQECAGEKSLGGR